MNQTVHQLFRGYLSHSVVYVSNDNMMLKTVGVMCARVGSSMILCEMVKVGKYAKEGE